MGEDDHSRATHWNHIYHLSNYIIILFCFMVQEDILVWYYSCFLKFGSNISYLGHSYDIFRFTLFLEPKCPLDGEKNKIRNKSKLQTYFENTAMFITWFFTPSHWNVLTKAIIIHFWSRFIVNAKKKLCLEIEDVNSEKLCLQIRKQKDKITMALWRFLNFSLWHSF